jgi:hypothetical protein
LSWTISWDMHRHPGASRSSTAREQTEAAALERAERFLKLGFVVYDIKNPSGVIVMDEAQIAARFGRGPQRDAE